MERFAKNLETLIKEKGMTQKGFAKNFGVSKNQVHYWIKGKAEPDLEMLTRIARYFEVSTDYLLDIDY